MLACRPTSKNGRESVLNFKNWLFPQRHRSGHVGTIANDAFIGSCCLPALVTIGKFIDHMEAVHQLGRFFEPIYTLRIEFDKAWEARTRTERVPQLLAFAERLDPGTNEERYHPVTGWCPNCSTWHLHFLVGPKVHAPMCVSPESLFAKSGYALKVSARPFSEYPKVRRETREGISQKLRFSVLARDRFTCVYCGRKAPEVVLEVDHKRSVADGEDNSPANLVTACEECNAGKGKRSI